MLKAIRHACFSTRLCQYQVFPTKIVNYLIYHQRRNATNNIKNEMPSTAMVFQFPNYTKGICNINHLRRYTNGIDADDDETNEVDINDQDDLNEYVDGEIVQLKDSLYDSLSDDLIEKIKICGSEEELLSMIKKNLDGLAQHHAVLALVKLWHYKKIQTKGMERSVDATDTLRTDENFHCLLKKILDFSGQMTLDELSVCFLYSTKLLVNMESDVMTRILKLILDMIKNEQSANIPLSALSRFTVAININTQLHIYTLCKDVVPHIFYYLERVNESSDFRLLTICMNNIHKLISDDSLELYTEKVQEFLACGKLNDDKTIFKILQFLNYPHWAQNHLPLIRKLMLQLKDDFDNFHIRDLELMSTIFQAHFEPSLIGSAIIKHAQTLLERTPTAELLACTAIYATPDKRQELTKFAKELIFATDVFDSSTSATLFKILRLLKISDVSICNEYWSKVRNEIINNPCNQENYTLSRYCHRYMYFNNNLNGTYRHFPFEQTIVKLIVNDFQHGITAFLPSKFAKVASFVLSYGHTPRSKIIFPEFIVQRMEAMAEQFTISDCVQLTRGMQIALQMRFNYAIHPELASQILRMESVLNACTERHLEQPDLSLSDLNSIVRSYNNRNSSRRTSIYNKIIQKYETVSHHPLTSRTIREITFNLNVAKCTIPSLCESMNKYITENNEYVVGDTVQKVLFCFYNLNYYPKNEEIFQCAAKIIQRDFNCMSGLAIVKACISLDFYKELPAHLIERVFNIDFIQRLEDEIEMCYSKAIYPKRVLNAIMQLNRAVCLDFPEIGVPWFQQNYIEAQMTKLPTVKNKFFNDVQRMLIDFAADENLVKMDHVTPYGYKVDFVLYFDKKKTLLKPHNIDDIVHEITKVAILLLDTDSFCQNDNEKISGKESLKQRHLEIMGYKVVQISYNLWNSMYMNVPGAKVNYLKKVLLA